MRQLFGDGLFFRISDNNDSIYLFKNNFFLNQHDTRRLVFLCVFSAIQSNSYNKNTEMQAREMTW